MKKNYIEYDYIVCNIGTEEEPAYKAIVPTLDAIIYGDSASELESGIVQMIKIQRRRRKVMPRPDQEKKDDKKVKKIILQMKSSIRQKIAA